MKPDDIFWGINEIDDELIYEAEAVPAYKRASGRRICAAAAFLILAVGFTVLIHESDTEHLSGIGKNSGIILVDETEYITSETDASREKKTEESVPQTISATAFIPPAASDTENQSIPYEITEAPTSAEEYTNTDDVQGFTSLSSDIPDSDKYDGMDNHNDKEDLSSLSFEEWLGNEDVVWGESDLKGIQNSEKIPPGTIKISPALQRIMDENTDRQTIYAVCVDFSSSINENEMNHWEYNGNTLSEIKAELEEITSNKNDEYSSEEKERISVLKTIFQETKSAYYSEKTESFRVTFERNGLGIYPYGIEGKFFCTFGTAEHFNEFVCGENEAFIFYPAGHFK